MGWDCIPGEIFQTESCEESMDVIEDVAEPLNDFVNEEFDKGTTFMGGYI